MKRTLRIATHIWRPPAKVCQGRLKQTPKVMLAWLLPLSTLTLAQSAWAQVAPASRGGDEAIFVGVDATEMHLQYGSETVFGYRGFVDANLTPHWGIEGAATWSRYREHNDVHANTYVAGPRYSFRQWRRTTVAVKGLLGGGNFYFPYGFAQGSYLVVSPGADVSFRINRIVRWQVIDVEYQYWPQFTYGAMQSAELSTGFRLRFY